MTLLKTISGVMSEVLGSQHFIACDFINAIKYLGAAFYNDPGNVGIHKKLIICYAMTGNVERSLDLFISMINKNPFVIINTGISDDDCPCPYLTEKIKKENIDNLGSADYFNILGELYLYCDLNESIAWFRKSIAFDKDQPRINSIIRVLTNLKVNNF
ncbi:hypothetical protein ACFL6O_05605 [candidate division KSB1 bacterium]